VRTATALWPIQETLPHPALISSVRVDLRTLDIKHRDFTDSRNPPILHRKELLVPSDYPGREDFQVLSEHEETHGLYDATNMIGLKEPWERLLESKGLRILNHHLLQL
jgi:hypothetical protein